MHVVVAGVVGERQLRIELGQLQQFVLHGEDAAYDDGGLGVDVGLSREHLREALVHAACDALVLPGAKRCQLALAATSVVAHGLDGSQHLAAAWRELAQRVGLGQHVVRLIEGIGANEPPRAVAAVVADIERLVTGGCRRERLCGSGVGAVVGGSQCVVSCYLGTALLRVGGQIKEKEKKSNLTAPPRAG